MRARLALALLLAMSLVAVSPLIGSAVAQDQVSAQEEESEGQDQGGQDPETETGAEEDQTEGAAEEETGPPWTYQMARVGIAIMVVLALGIGLAYYRFVMKRQRGVI